MSLIPLKPFWLNLILDSVLAYLLPNKPTEPHFQWNAQLSLHTAHICALSFAFLMCPHFAPDLSERRRRRITPLRTKRGGEGEKRQNIQKKRLQQKLTRRTWVHISRSAAGTRDEKLINKKRSRIQSGQSERKKKKWDMRGECLRSHSEAFPFSQRIVEPWSIPGFLLAGWAPAAPQGAGVTLHLWSEQGPSVCQDESVCVCVCACVSRR